MGRMMEGEDSWHRQVPNTLTAKGKRVTMTLQLPSKQLKVIVTNKGIETKISNTPEQRLFN